MSPDDTSRGDASRDDESPGDGPELSADTRAIERSRVFVDLMESAMNEAGDLLIPIAEGTIDQAHVLGEIGQVLAGAVEGRTAESDITLYKSLGIVAQDLFAAAHIYARALGEGVGTEVDLD